MLLLYILYIRYIFGIDALTLTNYKHSSTFSKERLYVLSIYLLLFNYEIIKKLTINQDIYWHFILWEE